MSIYGHIKQNQSYWEICWCFDANICDKLGSKVFETLKRGLKAKSMGVFKVWRSRIVLDYIGVDSILFDPAVPEIFYIKHDVGASNVMNFNDFCWQP